MSDLRLQAASAREAALKMQAVSTETKNRALIRAAALLKESADSILEANRRDLEAAREKGMSQAFVERLTLNEKRINGMAAGLLEVAALPDPVGETLEKWQRPNGLVIEKRRVPIGVIAIIYESRPNVTVDAAALCLKSGNAVVLRGGSDAIESNRALCAILQNAAREAGLPEGSVSLVEDTSREAANELMRLNGLIDVLIPRGGKGLIRSVVESATVPVIQTGEGVCHVYVDGDADPAMGLKIAVSAKVSRPSVCNAAETLLVDSKIAERFLPECLAALKAEGVEIRGCERTRAICPWVNDATEEDWDAEYNDLIYSVKVVDGADEAIAHINRHGTRHSEAIVTENPEAARRFFSLVDAACVYWNASTRFTDGGEFGFGAEIGISNQKLHARGPMGLKELTTIKYEITGSGQIR
jgi:glutamate-5-semialdehyde dehydrogenase